MTDRDLKPVNVIDESDLAVPCPICVAKVGERCASLCDASKYLPMSHAGRRVLAKSVKESQHAP